METVLDYLARAMAWGAAQEMGIAEFNDEDAPEELRNTEYRDGAVYVVVLDRKGKRREYRVEMTLVEVE